MTTLTAMYQCSKECSSDGQRDIAPSDIQKPTNFRKSRRKPANEEPIVQLDEEVLRTLKEE